MFQGILLAGEAGKGKPRLCLSRRMHTDGEAVAPCPQLPFRSHLLVNSRSMLHLPLPIIIMARAMAIARR